ncbi:phosphoglycerate mutase-like protein [Basidiobolus meristosporus CBS 931.73]|uniref:Phosphoglycerate mutase-like protein n=1 Tax=Basidiobolus meristosporus CBS 931.73 TaxID=1314790 RepID=A0A1Y1Z9N9_9FUNG|nr:phosphoglycerate mutase-like protein [Basidiobolus meristosporus CBS 931.73]|eukprot:ORY06988.1 phosphoglycerate mutase-like protein [Basidiobolus meristosporus CBS 931.73]
MPTRVVQRGFPLPNKLHCRRAPWGNSPFSSTTSIWQRPRKIILLRHGESVANLDKSIHRVVPDHKIRLTKKGVEQAREAGKRLQQEILPTDKLQFYVSPYLRTRQTFKELSSTLSTKEYIVYEEPRLREQDWGNFQAPPEIMKKICEEREKYGHFYYRIPNGESGADVYDRLSTFIESLHRAFDKPDFPSVLVLVTHGLMARLFVMRWFRTSVEEFESQDNLRHCEFIVMEKTPDERYKLNATLRKWKEPDVYEELMVRTDAAAQEVENLPPKLNENSA